MKIFLNHIKNETLDEIKTSLENLGGAYSAEHLAEPWRNT